MRQLMKSVWNVFRKGDNLLLLLCVLTSAFGCLVIASATDSRGSARYLIIQIGAILIGVLLYVAVSAINIDFIAEYRWVLMVFNIGLILLLIPFGVDFNSGNRSWLEIPGFPVSIQPAELCKLTFVLIMASVMAKYQRRISSPRAMGAMLFQVLVLAGLNIALSKDLGVSLIFIFIFAAMAWAGGVNLLWFMAGGGVIVTGFPFFWNHFLDQYQRNRFLILFDPTIDPMGLKERYHSRLSLQSLTGGGLTGQGLFNGNRTQIEALPSQHTDYIFSAIGEELGYLGCLLVIVLQAAIIARIIQIGSRSHDYLRKMVCYGAASALIFQVCSNIGMCIGVTPVIGLTLPFISYGGSSIVSLFALLGLVSGVHAKPEPRSHELYVRPPYDFR